MKTEPPRPLDPKACPRCGQPMATVEVTPAPTLWSVGLELHALRCACGHEETRQIDPDGKMQI